MLKELILGLCLLALPLAAAAADRGDEKSVAPEGGGGEAEATHAELIAYGKWLLELDCAIEPALRALRELGPAWQTAVARPTPAAAEAQFLPFLDDAERAVAAAKVRLTAMPEFRFERIELDAEAQPARVHAEMVRMLDQVTELVTSFRPLIRAIGSKDPKAGDAAVMKMLGSARTLFRAQAAMTGAFVATMEADDPARHSLMFDQIFYRSGMRLFTTTERMVRGQPDATLATDLAKLAEEMDGVIDRGLASVDASQAAAMTLRSELGADAEGVSARAMLDKSVAMESLYRESFAIARSYAGAMRATSKRLTGGAVTLPQLQPLINQLRDTRIRLDAVATRQAEILAGMR